MFHQKHGFLSAPLPSGTALLCLLPPPPPKPVLSHPAQQGVHRGLKVLFHKGVSTQTSRLLVLLPGLGSAIPHSFICSCSACLSAYYVPVTVLGTGDSLSLRGAHITLFPILVLSTRVSKRVFFISGCTCPLEWGLRGTRAQKTACHPQSCHRGPGVCRHGDGSRQKRAVSFRLVEEPARLC